MSFKFYCSHWFSSTTTENMFFLSTLLPVLVVSIFLCVSLQLCIITGSWFLTQNNQIPFSINKCNKTYFNKNMHSKKILLNGSFLQLSMHTFFSKIIHNRTGINLFIMCSKLFTPLNKGKTQKQFYISWFFNFMNISCQTLWISNFMNN